jgi:2-keto-4-pentenoate hydratase/2-oxohepta-3-ene-1,7-dioic acid hydratase in catechol pathway
LTSIAAASISDRMRLARYEQGGVARAGVVRGDEVFEVEGDPVALLADGALDAAANGAAGVALADVRLLAPVARPPKFFAIGLNYADHVAEAHLETPEFPVVFTKLSSCVNGPHDDVERPRVSDQLDYEGELGFVIGRRCRHVARADAPGVIAGYLAVNDVSVRDWQLRTQQWTLGKSFDTHGPIGPWLVSADEVGDPHALDIRTWVNGELRQQSNTSNLIHDCFALVELLSTVCTLEPGDIVSTGTPAGVGMLMDPPQLLRAGDVVRVEIERIGAIENRVIDEPPTGAKP